MVAIDDFGAGFSSLTRLRHRLTGLANRSRLEHALRAAVERADAVTALLLDDQSVAGRGGAPSCSSRRGT